MFYRSLELMSARPGTVSSLHECLWRHRQGMRGPPHTQTPGGFWPPPRRENMTSTSQRGNGFGFPLPRLFSFSFLLLQLEHPPQHFFKSDLNPKYVISALLLTPMLMLITVIRNKTLLVSTNKVVVSATLGLKATWGILHPNPTDPFTLFPLSQVTEGRALAFGLFFFFFACLLV